METKEERRRRKQAEAQAKRRSNPEFREKEREQRRARYAADRKKHIAQTRKHQDSKRAKINEHRKPCIACGESDPVVIDFHHPDPSVKELNIGGMVASRSLTSLLKEVDKCVCLCKNCHAKVHANTLTLLWSNVF